MSRIEAVTHEGNALAFGLDHALGWWYDVTAPGQDVPLEERSTAFNRLTRTELADYLDANLSSGDLVIYSVCIDCIRMDLDPQQALGWGGE